MGGFVWLHSCHSGSQTAACEWAEFATAFKRCGRHDDLHRGCAARAPRSYSVRKSARMTMRCGRSESSPCSAIDRKTEDAIAHGSTSPVGVPLGPEPFGLVT